MKREVWLGSLPELSMAIMERKFRRLEWNRDGGYEKYAETEDGESWTFVNPEAGVHHDMSSINVEARDWYEIIDEKDIIFNSMMIDIINDCEVYSKVLTEESIRDIYNKKENNMEDRIKDEAAKVFTDIEKRSKYTGELYGPDGKGKAILSFKKKKDAKKVLQLPENMGCYLVLRREVDVFTTEIPVVKAIGV